MKIREDFEKFIERQTDDFLEDLLEDFDQSYELSEEELNYLKNLKVKVTFED